MEQANQTTVLCASCGANVEGRFCTQCGAKAAATRCAGCSADLAAGAKFCHMCGTQVAPQRGSRKERTAWTVAGILVVLSAVGVAYLVGRRSNPAPVAQMGNAGNATGAPTVRAPDISSMGPRERFDRLFNRIAESQSTDTIGMFAPMALGAYQQLDVVDTDARFHAAVIHLIVQEFAQAKALADTIAASEPKHLFPSLIRGEIAEQENDTTVLNRSYAAFLANYDAELKAGRKEYLEHQPWLDQFRTKALANRR